LAKLSVGCSMIVQPGHSFQDRSVEGIRVDVVTEFEKMESFWRLAGAHSASFVFQSYDWVRNWHATLGQTQGIKPLLVRVADSSNRNLLIVPLGIRRWFGLKFLVFLGGGVSDYNAPLIDRRFADSCSASYFEMIWQTVLQELPPIDLIWFDLMPENVEGAPNPFVTLCHSVHTYTAHSASPLPRDFKTYRDARKSKTFTDAARRRRKAAEIGPVRFEVLDTPVQVLEIVEIVLAQKRQRYEMPPSYAAFYRRMAECQLDDGKLFACCLRVGRDIVATHVGAIYGRRFYYLVPAFDDRKWGQYAVARLLIIELISWCISKGLETFDMTTGDEEYKFFWTDTHLPIYTCRSAASLRGRCLLIGYSLYRKVRSKRSVSHLKKWLSGLLPFPQTW
jgi:CelD/BcsL family acetyltransferase involved in cellulose biosynthesis